MNALEVHNLSKLYRLGEVGTGTISHDLNRWWAKLRGKEDPFARIGTVNDRTDGSRTNDYVWALKDIDFEVKQGEILGVIGKNGAGKSTLLKLLSQVTAPTTGYIRAKGRVASLLEVGTGMHPEMTGRENVFLNGAILGMTRSEIRAKFDAIMDFAGCGKYADTPVKRYSSGMKVRLGFAVAAFLEPEILIVDEVLAVGDAEFQKKAIGKMQEVSRGGGRTVLFVSHNMSSIRQLCTRGILLENGGVKQIGAIDNVVESYLRNTNEEEANTLDALFDLDKESAVSITSISVSSDSEPKIIYGQNLKIHVRCFAQSDIENIEGAIAIDSLDFGHRVITLKSIETGYAFPMKTGSERVLTATLPEQVLLLPGKYRLHVALKQLDKLVHIRRNAITFYVENSIVHSEYRGEPGQIKVLADWNTV